MQYYTVKGFRFNLFLSLKVYQYEKEQREAAPSK